MTAAHREINQLIRRKRMEYPPHLPTVQSPTVERMREYLGFQSCFLREAWGFPPSQVSGLVSRLLKGVSRVEST